MQRVDAAVSARYDGAKGGSNKLTITDPNPAHAAMALQAQEPPVLSASQPVLLPLRIRRPTPSSQHPKADIHATPDGPRRHHAVHIGTPVQRGIEQARLFPSDLFHPTDALVSKPRHQARHDSPRDPHVEDGQRVVQRVVLGDGGVVEHDRADWEGERAQDRGRHRGRVWWEERLAENEQRETCRAEILLRAGLGWWWERVSSLSG